jgi:mRNA interferase RelE/StbE
LSDEPWALQMAGPAHRRPQRLPDKIAAAVLEFILGPLLQNPRRIGRPLRGDLTGLYAARVSSYRVVYEIDESQHKVIVVDVDHRADIYRPR